MCQACSILITKSNKVYWKTGVDSHDDLIKLYQKDDIELQDDKEPPHNTFARVEISPSNGDYLRPEKWEYKIDEKVRPDWIFPAHEELCWKEFEKWKKEVYSSFNLKEAKNPIHPFKIKAPTKITKRHIILLQKWDSVRASVGDSVRDSVGASVGDSVGASVGARVRDSVGASVGDSVGASVGASVWDSVWDSVGASVGDSVKASVGDSVGSYYGTLFPKIKKWKYCEKIKEKGYLFKSGAKLWKMGLVGVYDGIAKKWYLLGSLKGNGKCEILWEGSIN
jgi:hypothetical protein